MESGQSPVVPVRKTTITPKAIIFQKFGNKASYKVEEVQESAQNECPGLAIIQKGPCLFRCTLQLPEISVVSGNFKKKKDAEQSAAELALEKLGIDPTTDNLTPPDPWDALVSRIKYLFSNEFLTSPHPLSGHLRAALQREADKYSIPVSVLAVLDPKTCNLCKSIDLKVESNPFWVFSYVMRAASKLPEYVIASEEQFWIRRQNPYPPDVINSAIQQSGSLESFFIRAIYIPCSFEKNIEVVNLNVSSTGYYLDIIAKQLGLVDACKVLFTRPIGKASSETRLYFAAFDPYPLKTALDILNSGKAIHSEGASNTRASYLSSENIYGDAILASVGYTWRSSDLFHEDLTLQSYYRILLSKVPSGIYKLSRGAILSAELPSSFTTRNNWRGSFPRDILGSFCRHHRLLEPIFTVNNSKASPKPLESHKKLKVTDSAAQLTDPAAQMTDQANGIESVDTFKCEVKIYSKFWDLIIECQPEVSYKKQSDSIQNASLKVLLWLDKYFQNLDMTVDILEQSTCDLSIKFHHENFLKAFELCRSTQYFWHSELYDVNPTTSQEIDGPDSGISPSIGSLLCISCSVSLVIKGENSKELLESSDEFEFEFGSSSLISHIETVVNQMFVGQSSVICTKLLPPEFILAAVDDPERIFSLLSSKSCSLEYTVSLLQVTEPLEDRMEQALFSPPLSKQRVEYAVQHIRQSCATTLVDFGCGSGSLLDSLLNYQTSLEKIVGVDISRKSLVRAAKILNSKLNTKSEAGFQSTGIKSAILYDGSITDVDSRLYGFDIGTCLEVIEHMEEEQAWLFGDIALSCFLPKILIVSTPNYEYNVILQKSAILGQEEDPEDKNQSHTSKFRNHDHKFEWTREQFNHWATELATKHNYSVEFSGVGGSADVEPGFASQAAVFRRILGDDFEKVGHSKHLYDVVWEWNSGNE